MSGGGPDSTLSQFEDALGDRTIDDYVLTLFVAGASDMSVRAIRNVRAICETHLRGRYRLEVIDIHRDATLMSTYDVVAAPTLVRETPSPKRMLVGDLSDTARVLAALDIVVVVPAPAATAGP
jgi:circadian clock protein KaiB